jgi:hypothetical protein
MEGEEEYRTSRSDAGRIVVVQHRPHFVIENLCCIIG